MKVYINNNIECERLEAYNERYVTQHLYEGLKFICDQDFIAENIKVTNGNWFLQIAEIIAYSNCD